MRSYFMEAFFFIFTVALTHAEVNCLFSSQSDITKWKKIERYHIFIHPEQLDKHGKSCALGQFSVDILNKY